jgi:hypothetical protein
MSESDHSRRSLRLHAMSGLAWGAKLAMQWRLT